MGKRRENGSGTFTQLPSGKTRGRFYIELDGVIMRPSFTGSSDFDCKRKFKKWLASENKESIEKTKTVEEWAKHWLETYKKPKDGAPSSAYEGYCNAVNVHIIPVIGKQKINKVREAHLQKLINEAKTKKGTPLSRSSKEKILWALHGIFKTAKKNKLCTEDPSVDVKIMEDRKPTEVTAIKRDELPFVIDYLKKHKDGPALAVYLYTGSRPGEGVAIQWEDIDRDKRVIVLQRSLTKVLENGRNVLKITSGLKSENMRIVPYDEKLDIFLEALPHVADYVIARPIRARNNKGKILGYTHHNHRSLNKMLSDFIKDLNAELEELAKDSQGELVTVGTYTAHKLRHTLATYMRRGGVDLDVVRDMLGHKSISTTQIYDTVDIEDKKIAISKLPY